LTRSRFVAVLLGTLVVVIAATLARASEDDIDQERMLSEILQDKRLQDAKQRRDFSKRDSTPEEQAEQEEKDRQNEQEGGGAGGRFAILPQIGFSPEKGGNGGIKLTDRDFFGLTLDVSALAAQHGQAKGAVKVFAPNLFGGKLILAGTGLFEMDPSKRFFGLGNNELPDDEELSRNRYQHQMVSLLAALRLSRRFTLALSGGYNLVDIGHGSQSSTDEKPITGHEFPDMAGVRGGKTNPLAFSVIFDDRDEVTRPTRGWSVIAKAELVAPALWNDFAYRRYIFKASYLYPLLTRRQVLGVRLGGEYVDSDRRQVPFFELSSLGGGDDMRGFFPDRFLGRAKVILGGEYRLKLFDFNFFDIWNVKIDGVGFGDVGRVFMRENDAAAEQGITEQQLTALYKLVDKMRFSYGGGVRFALGEATIARVDVGFSEEETGLVYLVFGHTF
jgi:outer membrane protein assembly factor BamA